tara:strand:+ start:2157 stop:2306 length:150 start_codon:yes stop_codon:yes gene_type:complete
MALRPITGIGDAAPRRFHGEGRALLKVTNTGSQTTTFTILWTWFEQEEG